jgi:NitT/TauT family transport system substrate-binding protein
MFQRSSLSALAVVAVGGALIAGCSSSSSSSSSAPASAAATSAAASPTASSAPSGTTTSISAADCKIINQVSGGVISTLTPLQSESTSKATASLKAYVATLNADEAKLTSAGGKAALGAFIAAVQKASTETVSQATSGLEGAIGNLGSACSS